MSITVNLRYKGTNGSAKKFAEEMIESGTVDLIRKEEGNLRYEYYLSLEDPEELLLIDSWESQEAIDRHHQTPMMKTIAELREKYDLHMTVERYTSIAGEEKDSRFIRK
ncbi:MAG: antibiotic biosynthesis monooxygenase [Erysipelotrichaceae bacterium]|nr:antibiotic biosynthesis monooxygenase [Erysipelotrichaceae bacterium]